MGKAETTEMMMRRARRMVSWREFIGVGKGSKEMEEVRVFEVQTV